MKKADIRAAARALARMGGLALKKQRGRAHFVALGKRSAAARAKKKADRLSTDNS